MLLENSRQLAHRARAALGARRSGERQSVAEPRAVTVWPSTPTTRRPPAVVGHEIPCLLHRRLGLRVPLHLLDPARLVHQVSGISELIATPLSRSVWRVGCRGRPRQATISATATTRHRLHWQVHSLPAPFGGRWRTGTFRCRELTYCLCTCGRSPAQDDLLSQSTPIWLQTPDRSVAGGIVAGCLLQVGESTCAVLTAPVWQFLLPCVSGTLHASITSHS